MPVERVHIVPACGQQDPWDERAQTAHSSTRTVSVRMYFDIHLRSFLIVPGGRSFSIRHVRGSVGVTCDGERSEDRHERG